MSVYGGVEFFLLCVLVGITWDFDGGGGGYIESSDIIERRQKTNIGFHSRSPRAAGSDRSYIDDKSGTLDGESTTCH